MRILFCSLIVLFFSSLEIFAQAPQGISYQAIARNASGQILAGQTVDVRLSILTGIINGPVVYTESHTNSTNQFGLFTLSIGQGTAISGTFSSIDWKGGSKFLQVELSTDGGVNFDLAGTSQLLSVPYALYAERSGKSFETGQGLAFQNDTLSARTDSALWNANELQGFEVSPQTPQVGQLLMWDGKMWVPVDPTSSGVDRAKTLIYTVDGF